MNYRRAFWIIGAMISSLIPFTSAQAITVSPVLYDFEIAQGGRQDAVITVSNDTDEREVFTLHVQNFVAIGEEGEQQYLVEEEPTDLASWVIVDQPSVTLEPGGSSEFPILISVPDNADPGGHYATVFFSKGAGDTGVSGVGITEQVGVLLLVRVPGDIREEVAVESFRTKDDGFLNRLPVEFELRLRNLGSVHVRPSGTLRVQNMIGSIVARVPANPRKSAVLPDSIRRVDSIWAKTLDVPEGGFWTEVGNEWRNFAIGRYTVTPEVNYGAPEKGLQADPISFWIWPWRLILLAVLALVILIMIMKGYNTLIVRSALKNSKS